MRPISSALLVGLLIGLTSAMPALSQDKPAAEKPSAQKPSAEKPAPKRPAAAVSAAGAVTERLDDTKTFASGAEAFEKVCARCHLTGVGPDLSANEYDLDSLRHFVRNGYLAMPAFPESAIDEKTLGEIADYIAKTIHKGAAQ